MLYIVKNVFEVCIQLIDRIYVARMERHRDHRFDLVEFYFYNAVIVSNRARIQLFVICASAVDLIELADLSHRILQMEDRHVVSVVITSTPIR